MPSQKTGTHIPILAKNVKIVSIALALLIAVIVPTETPKIQLNTNAEMPK
jgi:hypothetical protein